MRRQTRNRLFTAVTGTALLLIALPAAAADSDPRELTDEQRARIEARFEELRARLELSEEQKAQLEPVLRQDFEKRVELMRRHGATPDSTERPSRQELRALRRELKAVGEATDAEVTRILDERQMQEYRKIREEARDEARERARSRRQESRS